MREIKFRAWNKVKSEMTQNLTLMQIGNGYGGLSFNQHGQADERFCYLMQYTGLKDINGKEIYEGDIIETSDGNCFVRYDEATTSYEVVFEDEAVISLWEAAVYGSEKVEVIGNIYENQDLLKS